jgi:putative tricarboxylic transport membrane protein
MTPISTPSHRTGQAAVGLAVLAVAALMVWGAMGIPADAGYAGVGPNFLPWVVAVALAVCGVMLLVEVARGGFARMPEPSGAAQGDWKALAWVSAGVVANAALIERIGFIVACAICFTLAVRGLRLAEGKGGGGLPRLAKDFLTGLAIAAPVFWLFTKVLAVNLPALTATGWL